MDKDHISLRQLLTLTFAALLSPAIRVLPGRTAQRAGEGGWLAVLVALPILLILCRGLFSLLRGTEEGGGLAEAAKRVLGPVLGRVVIGAYLVWGWFLLSANVRLIALRFLTISYRNASLPLFLVALLFLTLWLVCRPVGVLARAGEVFYLALTAGLVLSLAMGAFQMNADRVLPLWIEDVPNILSAGVPALGLLGYAIFSAFLGGRVIWPGDGRRKVRRWATAICITLTVLQLVCLGNFGPALTARMNTPFFMMVKGIGIEGTFQRVESVILALWILSDLALLGLLAWSCLIMAQNIFPVKEQKKVAVPLLLLAFVGGMWLFPDAFILSRTMDWLALAGNLVAGFLIPLLLLAVKKLRRLE